MAPSCDSHLLEKMTVTFYILPLRFLNDLDLGLSEAIELIDEGIDGLIGGGDVALEHFFFLGSTGGRQAVVQAGCFARGGRNKKMPLTG